MGRESSLHERACQVLSRAIQGFQVLPCSILCCFTAMQSEGLTAVLSLSSIKVRQLEYR